MWDNDIAFDKHQIIDTNPRPFPACIFFGLGCVTSTANTHFSADLATPVQEEPDMVTLLDFH